MNAITELHGSGVRLREPLTRSGLGRPDAMESKLKADFEDVSALVQSVYDSQEPVFSEELMCRVHAVTYDFVQKVGVVIMGDGSCTHMSGCIRMFEAIDPKVERISTGYTNNQPDTCYERHDGEWVALRSGLQRPYRQ